MKKTLRNIVLSGLLVATGLTTNGCNEVNSASNRSSLEQESNKTYIVMRDGDYYEKNKSNNQETPLTAGDTYIFDGIEFVYVPKGSFSMGYKVYGEKEIEMEIDRGYFMSKYEITQEQYERIMGENPSERKESGQHPVTNVNREDVKEFLDNLNEDRFSHEGSQGGVYDAPTEAEWEYACRAGTDTLFSFGDSISPTQATFGDYDKYSEVGKFPANSWGLHDMHGNVMELVTEGFSDYNRLALWKGGDYGAEDHRIGHIQLEVGRRFVRKDYEEGELTGGIRLVKIIPEDRPQYPYKESGFEDRFGKFDSDSMLSELYTNPSNPKLKVGDVTIGIKVEESQSRVYDLGNAGTLQERADDYYPTEIVEEIFSQDRVGVKGEIPVGNGETYPISVEVTKEPSDFTKIKEGAKAVLGIE